MSIRVRHRFQSSKSDGVDTTLVKPSNWNDTHLLETDGAGGVVLGRDTTGPGEIQELPLAYNGAGSWIMGGVGAMTPPTGTTAQRTAGPPGSIRYNQELGQLEALVGGVWSKLSVAADTTVPAGIIQAYGGGGVPSGYLLCDGARVLRATYPALFSAIGLAYDTTNDGTTFQLPDLRGKTPAGADPTGVNSGFAAPVGTKYGEPANVFNVLLTHLPPHSHPITPAGARAGANGGSGATGVGNVLQDAAADIATGNAGGGTAITLNNYGPTLFINYVIKI